MSGRVDNILSASRTRLAEAARTGRGVEAARDVAAALERAAEVLTPPLAVVSLFPQLHARRNEPPPPGASLMPHLHARPQEPAPPGASLLTPAQRADLDARRGVPGPDRPALSTPGLEPLPDGLRCGRGAARREAPAVSRARARAATVQRRAADRPSDPPKPPAPIVRLR